MIIGQKKVKEPTVTPGTCHQCESIYKKPIPRTENVKFDFKTIFSKSLSTKDLLFIILKQLKFITQSEDTHLYLLQNNQIYREIPSSCKSFPTKWNLSCGTIVAAQVATTKTVWWTNAGLMKNQFNYGVGRSGEPPQVMMAIPMINSLTGEVIAVFELNRKFSKKPYLEAEVDVATALIGWASTTVVQRFYDVRSRRDEKFLNEAYYLLVKFINKKTTLSRFMRHILIKTRDSVTADGIELIEFVRMIPPTIVTIVQDPNDHSRMKKKKKHPRLISEDNIILEVLRCGTMKTVDLENGYFEIYCPMYLLEYAKCILLFKSNHKFDAEDIIILRSMIYFMSTAKNFHHTLIYTYRKVHLNQSLYDAFVRQVKPCHHDMEFITQMFETSRSALPTNFSSFSWYPNLQERSDNLVLINYTMNMFEIVLGAKFIRENSRLGEFVMSVKKNYKDLPYHNFLHAFNTTHTVFCMLIKNAERFYFLEVIAMMIASLCHDLDHPGTTAGYLILSDSYLCRLYSGAILERHHSFMMRTLLVSCGLFGNIPASDYKLLLNSIEDLILATDLSSHFRVRSTLTSVIMESGFDWNNNLHRDNLKRIMMTASDLSICFKETEVARETIKNLYIELYSQGDLEKRMGLVPMAMLDRDRQPLIPNDQVSFLTLICMPCYEILITILPVTYQVYQKCCDLREYWSKQSSGNEPSKSDLMKIPEDFIFPEIKPRYRCSASWNEPLEE